MREYYYFSIGFEDKKWAGDEEEKARRNALAKKFTEPFGIRNGFAGKGIIDGDHPMFDQFLETLELYARTNNLIFRDNCGYEQRSDDAEWFKYVPTKTVESISYQGKLICCEAYKILPDIDVGTVHTADLAVSEKFKRVVEENQLTGIEFIWYKDIGKFAPPKQWYMPVVTSFIGRGLDAPWVDINSPHLRDNEKYDKQLGRKSVTRFTAKCLDPKAKLPRHLLQYLQICEDSSFRFHFHERLGNTSQILILHLAIFQGGKVST
ncbi:hypothetical protein [Paenibacillus albus]|uniref:Uncharacterized protein n=1 Tax=Paenibacillus albus TaxID=2495582 RepID=A0A3Q8X417_9BACL|nr:hypothetical protein [Paenibacillus albus]AZN39921.1 hypothetical protein EJC50_09870 [Paenibacillus albus]